MSASASTSGPKRTVQLLQEFSIPLILGVIAAIVWANLAPDSYEHYITGHHGHGPFSWFVNDIFMCFFFGIAAKEITEAVLPGGALNPPRKAINPLLGTLGGVLGPVGVYFGWMALTNDFSIQNGWGIPTATDIALAWLVARICFGKGHPAVSFLLLLAVADDAIGLGIIAVAYPQKAPEPMYLALLPLAMGIAYALRKKKVQTYWAYLIVPGALSWCALYFANLHPALALVPIVPFMPAASHDEGLFAEESDGKAHTDTLNRFEHEFKVFVDFGLFAFGLANAGVAFESMGNPTWAVLAGLLVGKTVGIFLFSSIGHAVGFKLPDGMNLRSLLVAGMVAALGLTVALFVAGAAFKGDLVHFQGSAKMGALLSVCVIPIALIAAALLRVKENPAKKAEAGGHQRASEKPLSVHPPASVAPPAE